MCPPGPRDPFDATFSTLCHHKTLFHQSNSLSKLSVNSKPGSFRARMEFWRGTPQNGAHEHRISTSKMQKTIFAHLYPVICSIMGNRQTAGFQNFEQHRSSDRTAEAIAIWLPTLSIPRKGRFRNDAHRYNHSAHRRPSAYRLKNPPQRYADP